MFEAFTTVVIVNVTVSPTGKSPIVQIPVSLSYAPPESSETYIKPSGIMSFNVVFIASSGPLLVTLMVQTTVSPMWVVTF